MEILRSYPRWEKINLAAMSFIVSTTHRSVHILPIALQNFASLVPGTVDLQMAPVSARTLQYICRELGRLHAVVLRVYADAGLSRDVW